MVFEIFFSVLSILVVIAACVWAIIAKYRKAKIFEAVVTACCGTAVVVDMISMALLFHGVSDYSFIKFLQSVSSVLIVPLVFLYFTKQFRGEWQTIPNSIIWILAFLIFIPSTIIVLDETPVFLDGFETKPFRLYFVKHGSVAYKMFTADMILLIQSLITIFVMGLKIHIIRRYGLKLSRNISIFFAWWIGSFLFIVVTSFVSTSTMAGSSMFFIILAAMATMMLVMQALHFDLNPVVTKTDEEVVENPSEYIEAYKKMARRVNVLITEEKVYLNSSYKVSDAVAAVGTNRTYFSNMMNSEYGCKFTDLLNRKRIEHAKELLLSTNKTISEIAEESGFSDASYMTRRFTAEEGISPKQWRTNNKH